MNTARGVWIGGVVVAALLTVAGAQHQHGAAEAAFVFTGDALEGPDRLAAGYHVLVVQNDSDAIIDFDLVRMREGVRAQDALAAMREAEAAAMADGDFVAALEATLEVVELWGGALVFPGAQPGVGVELEPGEYGVIVRIGHLPDAEDDGIGYLVRSLEVTAMDASAAQPPVADVTVDMVDFAYGIPERLPAGPQVWYVVNRGRQVHHLSLMRLRPEASYDDVMRYMATEEGEPPGEYVASTNILSAGVGNYLMLDLEPGTYVLACFLPDHENGTGEPHFLLGMVSMVTLEED